MDDFLIKRFCDLVRKEIDSSKIKDQYPMVNFYCSLVDGIWPKFELSIMSTKLMCHHEIRCISVADIEYNRLGLNYFSKYVAEEMIQRAEIEIRKVDRPASCAAADRGIFAID